MKKHLYLLTSIFNSHGKKYLLSDQRGAILVALIFGMVIVAGVGAAVISLNTTTSFNQFGANESMKAYYLAEAGRRYVLQQANAGVDITTIPNTTLTLANGDQFVLTNMTYGNLLNLSFRSTGTTTAGVNREINYSRSTDPLQNLSNDPGQGLSEPGGDDEDEAFDNDCDDSHGYRSNNSGPAIVGVAYIGYDIGATPPGPPPAQVKISFLEYAGPEDGGENAIASARFQGSNDINFGVGNIGADVTLTLNTEDNPRGPCSASFFQGFILPTTFGAFQYWRLLANAPATDEWEVQEFRMYGEAAASMVETQT